MSAIIIIVACVAALSLIALLSCLLMVRHKLFYLALNPPLSGYIVHLVITFSASPSSLRWPVP
jgi:hypothetical protein